MRNKIEMAKVTRGARSETAKGRVDLARLRIFFAKILSSLAGLFFFFVPETLDLIDVDMTTDGLFELISHSYNYNYF